MAVKKWQRERGTTKKKRRKRWRSGTSKSHPKKYPEWREAKRRVVWVLVGTSDFGVFLAVPLPFIFYGKREGAERRPRLRHPPPSSS